MPRSERTQRMSVLVTTQMKVSSGVGFHSWRVEEQHERLVRAKLRLHLLRGKRRRARERGVIRELRRQLLIDLLYPRIDGGEPRIVLRLGLCDRAWRTPGRAAALRSPSRFCHSATRSWRSRTSAASSGSPVAPRAAICASEARLRSFAPIARSRTSRARPPHRARGLPARDGTPP